MDSEYSNISTTTESILENYMLEDFHNINIQDIISYISYYFQNLINENHKNKNKKKEKKIDEFYSRKIPLLTIEQYLNRIIKYTQMENSTLIISFIFILQILEKENYYICKNNIYRIILSSCLIANKVNDEFHFKNSYFSKIGGLNLNEMNYLEYSFLNKMNFKLYINEGEFYFILDKIIRSVKEKNY